jgi:DUF2993 family protein
MRRFIWVALAIVVAALAWSVVPSALLTRRVRNAVQTEVQPTGPLSVSVRTTLPAMLRRRAQTVEIEAAGARLGDVTADHLRVHLRGVRLRDGEGGRLTADVDAGTVDVEVSAANLEQFLRSRGVDHPTVSMTTSGIAVSGDVHVGPVQAKAQMEGQFYVVGTTDVHFRITSLSMSGVEVPPTLATAVLGLTTTPLLSLGRLPVKVSIDRIEMRPGKTVLHARAGDSRP